MELQINECVRSMRAVESTMLEEACDSEPRRYEGEPTEWTNYLSGRHRAELEVALLDLCRFFVAQIAAEQNKSAATLQLVGVERQVVVQGRNSKGDEGRGSSARAQMFIAAKKLVAEDCWPIAVWYEYAQSAYLKWTQPRKWFNKKYKAIEAGDVKAKILMPTFPSRMTRRISEMTAWLDLLEHQGMRMICASHAGHHWDTELEDTADWWLEQAKISQGTSAASSKMIHNKQFEMLADGIVTRGYGKCYGYAPVTNPERITERGTPAEVGARLVRVRPLDRGRSEAEWLEWAFKKRLAGLTWADVARECYQEGCRSRAGTMIRSGSWKRILTAERVIGCERKNGQLFRVQIERLVPDEQYEKLMAMEGLDPSTGKRIAESMRAQRRSYPLTGLLRCPCGASMVASKRSRHSRYWEETRYKCSRPNRHLHSAEGKSWTPEVAMDGLRHTTIRAESAHELLRELCADAIASFDDEVWRRLERHADAARPSLEIDEIERQIAALDDDAALLDIQIKRQRQPGYRGDKMTPAEVEKQVAANASRRAELVRRRMIVQETTAPTPVFPRHADVRAEIRNCTDGELRVFVKRVFARVSVRASNPDENETPERRIEWETAKGYHIDPDLVERLLAAADEARVDRYIARSKRRKDNRDTGTLEDDAYLLARKGLTTTEITRELNALGHRTSKGTPLATGWVNRVVRRVMYERDSQAWISPQSRVRGVSDEQLDRAERMREGGATWKEVGEAFGSRPDRIRAAYYRRRTRRASGARPGRLNRNVEVLCFEMRRLEGATWSSIAREMMRLRHKTPLSRRTWFPATVKHIVEQLERREPEWCAARIAKHEAQQAAKRDAA